jgi:iron complex outermembrane receptor protein
MRRIYLHSIILSSLIIVFANTFSFSQNAIITGKVKYGKEALQAATVSVENKTVFSDNKGEFSLSIKPGKYILIITHVGYEKIQQTISVDANSARTFDFNMEPSGQLGEVVLLGSRSLIQRSNLNTAVPVDAFSSAQLHETNQTSLMQMLNFTAPSLNASLQNGHESVTLRGLYPDQILILLNGTRYNNTAYINNGVPRGQLGWGSVGNDLNSIPFSGIEKIEILRDGASAQYGSDAVAGVINIFLKESVGKTSVNLHLGQYYKGDGENIKLGVYRGFALNTRGLLTFAADFRYRKPTFRGGEFKGTVYANYPANPTPADSIRIKSIDDSIIQARRFDRMQVSNAGNSKLESFGVLINGAYSLSNKTKIFWTAAMNNLSFTLSLPTIFPKVGTQVNTELFPDGFRGRIKPDTWNVSGIAGIKGVTGKGIHWEYRSAYGINEARFNSENTNNASQQFTLGKAAPTKFYTGTLIYQQLTNSIHFTENISSPGNKVKTINLGWGAELRFENFRMKAGEEASWYNYDTSFKKLGGSQISLVVAPNNELNENRSVLGAYVDFEEELNDRLLLNLAGRFEHYSDFGSNLAGKLAARYRLSDKLSFRGSVNNGFRAPSMQQRYWGTIYSGVIRGGNASVPSTLGVFNSDNTVTKIFGVPTLDAEKSLNMNVGLTSAISKYVYFTIDAYWIQIRNRVVLSGVFNRRTNPEVDSLLKDPSLNGYTYVAQVQFFSNAVSTRTQGVDAVLNGKWSIHKAQLVAFLSANFTRTRLFGKVKTATNLRATTENQNTLFNQEQKARVENGQPRSKFILNLNYKTGKFGFVLRNTRFGETAIHYAPRPKETFSPKIITDVTVRYAPKSWVTITTGANNIFDVYPDRIKNYGNTNEGLYLFAMESSPFGFNGGYYFVSMSLNF